MKPYRLESVNIQGYRPFRDFQAGVGALEVFVGANGSGKSALFEFLRFLRDSLQRDIPPEIVAGSIGQQIFHIPGPERFQWKLEIQADLKVPVQYQGELLGPVGRTKVASELIRTVRPLFDPKIDKELFVLLEVNNGQGVLREPTRMNALKKRQILLPRINQLALSLATNPAFISTYRLREYISGWRFYGTSKLATENIRRSVPIEQEPMLYEDASNLSSVLHYLLTEHQPLFDELQHHLRSVIPGFKGLTVKARGGPGEVIAFWREESFDRDLSLADLSEGTLRLICWCVLCLHPNPPALICIDEPDQGLHPRALPLLAGLFEKASARTQIFLATHSSWFLMQFPLSSIAVIRKESGEARFFRPINSATLRENLEDFGPDELEFMHRNDELEHQV